MFEELSHVTLLSWLCAKMNQEIRLFYKQDLRRADMVIRSFQQAHGLPILPDLRRVSGF